jgi:hypothetical protein
MLLGSIFLAKLFFQDGNYRSSLFTTCISNPLAFQMLRHISPKIQFLLIKTQKTRKIRIKNHSLRGAMLIAFSITNFMSIKDKQTFSFVGSSDKNLLESITFEFGSGKNNRLLILVLFMEQMLQEKQI